MSEMLAPSLQLETESAKRSPLPSTRPQVRGKFLFAGDQKLYLTGVTYGTFRPDGDGVQFPDRNTVRRDFAAMAENGVNACRTYTAPPTWLLDEAHRAGLWVMVGLPWEQHIAFLDDQRRTDEIVQRVRATVRSCCQHPAVLCYAIGNEIPSAIVRWHGQKRIESFLQRLFAAVKYEDPEALVTYVNYPTTEYLQLDFLDFVCFNVYLENEEKLTSYLARLQILAGDRPLVMAEVGLDSGRNGQASQARVLSWQIPAVFSSGCAGIFIFAWTDEWHRGGYDIEDWDFGLVTRDRLPKPALQAVKEQFSAVPFRVDADWPRISVVVCSYNGERTIGETLDSLVRLEYPNYEIIVVDDGSTDSTAAIANRPEVRMIRTANGGLSQARNVGINAATGSIVAFIDDDAYADPHWLAYLAHVFMTTDFVAVGGPNLSPAADGLMAAAVANAPGGPIHVLISDREAEHIPGVNSAYRRKHLLEIGGFDPMLRVAGDDVDVCWRLIDRGWKIGFSPAAVVWHHRRSRLRDYLRQQLGYGKAEALLERKHPEKYNTIGHVSWRGRVYGNSVMRPIGLPSRIYHGTWNSAPFQPLYQERGSLLQTLVQMPEWYVVTAFLGMLCGLSVFWPRMFILTPAFLGAAMLPLAQVLAGGARAALPGVCSFDHARSGRVRLLQLKALTILLFAAQPLARLYGRLQLGLTVWRRKNAPLTWPFLRTLTLWSETWRSQEQWLAALELALPVRGVSVSRGGNFDRFDLYLWFGLIGGVKVLSAVEEHGGAKQLLRFRIVPRISRLAWVAGFLALASGWAAFESSYVAAGILGFLSMALMVDTLMECAAAAGCFRKALQDVGNKIQ